jgi:hypothetical protein
VDSEPRRKRFPRRRGDPSRARQRCAFYHRRLQCTARLS